MLKESCRAGLAECYAVLLRKRYEAIHDLSPMVGRFGQFPNSTSNQFGFLECEVFSTCEHTRPASNPLLHAQTLTLFIYVLVLCYA